MDQATVHISEDSLNFLKDKEINFVLIPAGMRPECQPLDISVNKIFKDQIKLKFEANRVFFETIDKKINFR